jgi:hypothetical protein
MVANASAAIQTVALAVRRANLSWVGSGFLIYASNLATIRATCVAVHRQPPRAVGMRRSLRARATAARAVMRRRAQLCAYASPFPRLMPSLVSLKMSPSLAGAVRSCWIRPSLR